MATLEHEEMPTSSNVAPEFQEALFDPDLDQKYMCPVCLCILKEPMQTSCGHRFCTECLKGSFPIVCRLRMLQYSKCPVDNTYFHTENELFADNAIKREILSLDVRCPNIQHGCPWKGELRNYNDAHEGKCEFKLIACENSCGLKLYRHELPQHLPQCGMRHVNCPHCDQMLSHSLLLKHEVLVCQNFPVQCLLCGQVGIKRKDIASHVDKQTGNCPKSEVLCPYSKYGCEFETTRICMPIHIQEGSHLHLTLVVGYIQTMDSRISQLADEVSGLRHSTTTDGPQRTSSQPTETTE